MAQKTLEHLHKDIEDVKKDIALIKNILYEEYEISEQTKKDLEEARNAPDSEYTSHEEVKKRLKL